MDDFLENENNLPKDSQTLKSFMLYLYYFLLVKSLHSFSLLILYNYLEKKGKEIQ